MEQLGQFKASLESGASNASIVEKCPQSTSLLRKPAYNMIWIQDYTQRETPGCVAIQSIHSSRMQAVN